MILGELIQIKYESKAIKHFRSCSQSNSGFTKQNSNINKNILHHM
jgi:hypothetical protein